MCFILKAWARVIGSRCVVGVASVTFVVSCQRLCSLAQSTKQQMEDGACLRRSDEADPASSGEDSGLEVKVSNTTEEESKDETPASGQFFRQSENRIFN